MKINNYNEFKEYLNSLKEKPKLLLHVCCAPCSSHCLEVLKDYFEITVYFSNDNMMGIEEYQKRLNELEKYVSKRAYNIPIIDGTYTPNDYYNAIKGLENLGEKSPRCYNCYELRLRKTCKYAKENGFDFYTTTLSVSPHKLSDWINEIGYRLEEELDMPYLFSNFKKEEGFKDSTKLSKEFNLYCQCFCGCIYSYQEYKKKVDAINENIRNIVVNK